MKTCHKTQPKRFQTANHPILALPRVQGPGTAQERIFQSPVLSVKGPAASACVHANMGLVRLHHFCWDPQRGGELPRGWSGWRGQAPGLGTPGAGGAPWLPWDPELRCGWVPMPNPVLAGGPSGDGKQGDGSAGAGSPPCWGWGPLSPQAVGLAGEWPAAARGWAGGLAGGLSGATFSGWVLWVGAAGRGAWGCGCPSLAPAFACRKFQ